MKKHSNSQPNLKFLKCTTKQLNQFVHTKTEASSESTPVNRKLLNSFRFNLLKQPDTAFKDSRMKTQQKTINQETRPQSRILMTPRENRKYLLQDVYYMSELKKSYGNNQLNGYFEKLFRDHFDTSYFSLRSCMKQNIVYKPKLIRLSEPQKKYTLLFDLDETLVHCSLDLLSPFDKKIPIKIQYEYLNIGVNVRPGLQEMLETLSQKFEIFVFTASHATYAKKIIEYIDQKGFISQILSREHCCFTSGSLYIKDLALLNRPLSKMILIDNSSCSYYLQPDNGIPIIPYFENKQDKQLQYLTKYLNETEFGDDVRNAIKNTFKTSQLQMVASLDHAQQILMGKLQ